MDIREIIQSIDVEIQRLEQVKALLNGTTARRKPGRPAKSASSGNATSFDPATFNGRSPKRRPLSAAARKKIAAAQRKRWAKTRAAAKKTAASS